MWIQFGKISSPLFLSISNYFDTIPTRVIHYGEIDLKASEFLDVR